MTFSLRAVLVVAIVSTISLSQSPTILLDLGEDSSLSEAPGLDLIVTDSSGLPVSGATYQVFDAWTGVTLAGPATMDDSRELIHEVPDTPVRIHLLHQNYAGEWVNEATPWDESKTVVMSGLDSILTVHGEQLVSATISLDGHLGSYSAQGSGDSLTTNILPNSTGWIHAEGVNGSTIQRWSGETTVNVSVNETVRIFGWADTANRSGSLRIEHIESATWYLEDWEGSIDFELPIASEGEWRIWRQHDGVRLGEAIIANGSQATDVSSLMGELVSLPLRDGSVAIDFLEEPIPGGETNLSYHANRTHDLDDGTHLLPGLSDGLTIQVDRWLGDSDGELSQSEITAYSDMMLAYSWNRIDHVMRIDGEDIRGNVTISDFELDINNGTVSWSESADLTALTGHSSSNHLWFPVRGDSSEQFPITVYLEGEWEVRYSPQLSLLTGEPDWFEMDRSISPTVGTWTVTVAKNQVPLVTADLVNRSGLSIPLTQEITLDGICSDSGIGSHDYLWMIKLDGQEILNSTEQTISFTPEEIGFSHGEILNTTVSCIDWASETAYWDIEYYVDGEAPSAEFNAIIEAHEVEPYTVNLSDDFSIPAGHDLRLSAATWDDSGVPVTIEWRSNKSAGWMHGGFDFVDSFDQGDDVNWLHMTVEERHMQRQPTIYSLNVTVTDQAGNQLFREWNVTVLDNSGPRITAEMLVYETPIGPLNPARPDSEVILNLTRSFDDIDAVELTTWSLFVDGVAIYNNRAWEEARITTLPSLDPGEHEIRIVAKDSAGNEREHIANPIYQVQSSALVVGVEAISNEGAVTGEPGRFVVKVQNEGGGKATVEVCLGDECSGLKTINEGELGNPAELIIFLEIETMPTGQVDLTVEWEDTSTQVGDTFTIKANGAAQSGWDSDWNPLIIILAIVGILAWLLRGGSKEKAPF